MKFTEKLERREREEQKAERRTAEEWNVLDHEDVEAGREEPITPLSFLSATGRHPVRRDRPQQGHKDQRGIRVCKRTQEPTLHRSTRNTVNRDNWKLGGEPAVEP